MHSEVRGRAQRCARMLGGGRTCSEVGGRAQRCAGVLTGVRTCLEVRRRAWRCVCAVVSWCPRIIEGVRLGSGGCGCARL